MKRSSRERTGRSTAETRGRRDKLPAVWGEEETTRKSRGRQRSRSRKKRDRVVFRTFLPVLLFMLLILTIAFLWEGLRESKRIRPERETESSTKTDRDSVPQTTVGEDSTAVLENGREDPTEGAAVSEAKAEETAVDTEEKAAILPTAEESTEGTEAEIPLSDVTLLFAGDVYFSEHVLSAYERAGDISGVLDESIREEIEKADLFMVNEEFPFTDRGTKAEDKQYTFRLPPAKVSMLQEMGVDLVTLANNHILDYGEQGLLDTLDTLEAAGIPYVGGGRNLAEAKTLRLFTLGGRRLGFLGTSRVYMDPSWAAGPEHPGVFSTYDPTAALQAIREAKTQCDYLVVYVHWGVERETEPKEYQRSMGRAYIDAGADLVVGAHPHVLQEVEEYQGKYIAYSLGNFVFGSSIPSTELLKLTLSGNDGTATMELLPCTSSGGYTRRQ